MKFNTHLHITSFSSRQRGKLKEDIIKEFKDYNLNITIEIGAEKVHFLDVTLDLTKGTYKPYRKAGDKIMYVSSWSNHPPVVLNNIPLRINRRLCSIYSNAEVFRAEISPYQTKLRNQGYDHSLTWMEEGHRNRCRRRAEKRI